MPVIMRIFVKHSMKELVGFRYLLIKLICVCVADKNDGRPTVIIYQPFVKVLCRSPYLVTSSNHQASNWRRQNEALRTHFWGDEMTGPSFNSWPNKVGKLKRNQIVAWRTKSPSFKEVVVRKQNANG